MGAKRSRGAKRIIVGLWRLSVAVLCFVATAGAWSVPVRWVYASFQMGLLAGLVMLWAGAATLIDGIQPPAWLKNGVTVYMVVVGGVSLALPSFPSAVASWGMSPVLGVSVETMVRLVIPAVLVVDFLLVDDHRRSRWTHLLTWLSYCPIYLAFVLIRAALWPSSGPAAGGGAYPYDAIDIRSLGWIQWGINCLQLAAACAAAGLMVFLVDRILPARSLLGTGGRSPKSSQKR
ncbi:Pr6Pr family membrane protein [uncultured Bifidobacterium sp.]|uniref:Pr6Pr family membrane protein n=1 Tax=uncultured Bifidobacterium sp. TaxID=165187 RepID=UPI00262E3C2F|nr:Pr6Pr family membrane protein [uncultured Bifidobacterium sp.]